MIVSFIALLVLFKVNPTPVTRSGTNGKRGNISEHNNSQTVVHDNLNRQKNR